MKLDRFETHDRYEHVTKQDFDIGACCQDMINQRPFGKHPFYIFAHPRTDDDGVTKRMIWQPRLTKPKAQTNSMLFKGYPGSENIKIIWIIPDRHLWPEFQMGKMMQNTTILESIHDFQHNRPKMEEKEKDDLDDIQIGKIYKDIAREAKFKRATANKIIKPDFLASSLPLA